jgi:hypothetical protein
VTAKANRSVGTAHADGLRVPGAIEGGRNFVMFYSISKKLF